MNPIKPFVLLLLFVTCSIAHARTWTSKDGRTREGDFISADHESVKVLRNDGTTVVLPFSLVSDQDFAWVQKQPKPVEITQAHLDAILALFPQAASIGRGEVTNELHQLQLKYLSMVKFIRPGTLTAKLKMIRSKIESDIKVLEQIAKTMPGDFTGRRSSGQSQAAESTILSARSSLGWLQWSLTPYLKEYDTLQNQALSGTLR